MWHQHTTHRTAVCSVRIAGYTTAHTSVEICKGHCAKVAWAGQASSALARSWPCLTCLLGVVLAAPAGSQLQQHCTHAHAACDSLGAVGDSLGAVV